MNELLNCKIYQKGTVNIHNIKDHLNYLVIDDHCFVFNQCIFDKGNYKTIFIKRIDKDIYKCIKLNDKYIHCNNDVMDIINEYNHSEQYINDELLKFIFSYVCIEDIIKIYSVDTRFREIINDYCYELYVKEFESKYYMKQLGGSGHYKGLANKVYLPKEIMLTDNLDLHWYKQYKRITVWDGRFVRFINKRIHREAILYDAHNNDIKLNIYPTELTMLKNIKGIILTDHIFKDIPQDICIYNNLVYLSINNNLIQTIPKWVSKLKLHIINLAGNIIKDITNLCLIQTIKTINVSNNYIECLPEAILQLKHLKILDISGNRKIDKNDPIIQQLRDTGVEVILDKINTK